MADDDDVPPLEDMSEMLQQVAALRQAKTQATSQQQQATSSHRSNTEKVDRLSGDTPDTKKTLEGKSADSKEVGSKTSKASSKSGSTFGGMKKGFLFGSSKSDHKSSTKQKADTGSSRKVDSDVPFIKPKDPNAAAAGLKLPEVEEAMNATQSFLNDKEWVTDDLLSRIQSSDELAEKLTNPVFMQAINEFQTNPQAAMLKYQNNPEIQLFFKQFCTLLGDHFTKLGDKDNENKSPAQTSPIISSSSAHTEGADISVHSSTNPKQPTAADERKMQDLLNNPEIRGVLMDPNIQKLFEMLRNDPSRGQEMLKDADADLQKKIRKLVDAGLLQFQR